MSWFWGSSKPSSQQVESKGTSASTSKTEPSPFSSVPPPPASSQPLSREEQATLEFNELLKEFQEQAESEKDARVKAKEAGTSNTTPIPDDISPDSLYPREMSCRSALDYAMFCQSFGGQFVNVYRYGEFRSCSNHWSDFWLCMRTRNWDEKDRVKAVKDHYRQKAVKWKTGRSSEDVWEVRTEPVKDAFQDNLEDLEAKIAEWKRSNPGIQDPWLKQQGSSFNNPAPST